MTYLLYAPAQSTTSDGRDLNDRMRLGVFVACSAVVASNTYVLLNTYRWDWLTVLINIISSLLIWLCTGIYSAVLASGQFYNAAAEVFGTLNFWALTFLTVTLCLAPRFAIKSFQKIYMPRDVDIIREQVIMGKFKYLDNYEAYVPPAAGAMAMSTTSSDLIKPVDKSAPRPIDVPEDERPIYPPSVAPTATTRNHRSQNGSDGTDYTASLDFRHRPQQSTDRGPTSFDRARASMDQLRPSFEANNDFTSAAMLARHECGRSRPPSPQNGLILHSQERHPSNYQ